MERVGIIRRVNPTGRVHDGFQLRRPGSFEVSGVETSLRRQDAVDLNQASNNLVETEMGEDRLRDAVVELDVELKELESIVDQQMDLSVRQARRFNFAPPTPDELTNAIANRSSMAIARRAAVPSREWPASPTALEFTALSVSR